MKAFKILVPAIALAFTMSCQQQNTKSSQSQASGNQPLVSATKSDDKSAPNKTILSNLDLVLSPFEDMTEFALNKDKAAILKSIQKVDEASKNKLFEKSITPEGQKLLIPKIDKLKELIKQNNYSQIAIESTEIFGLNISNFADAHSIENQIKIEHLDYMGFKTLALLNQDKIDWKSVKQTVSDGKKVWLSLNSKVKNVNITDTFDYLFKGLTLGADNTDVNMSKILANMDLTLVDVLEGSF